MSGLVGGGRVVVSGLVGGGIVVVPGLVGGGIVVVLGLVGEGRVVVLGLVGGGRVVVLGLVGGGRGRVVVPDVDVCVLNPGNGLISKGFGGSLFGLAILVYKSTSYFSL